MADAEIHGLTRDAPNDFLLVSDGARLVAEPGLGMAKLQVLADDPDAWFEEALGIAAPPALREVALHPVYCAWMAPGEWLVTGPETDIEIIRVRCADVAGHLGLMIDLTHARTAFELSGSAARSILATHCPLDFRDSEMPIGAATRSLFSDTGFFISRRPDRSGQPCYRLIFDQIMASYAENMLSTTISGMNL